MVEILLDSIKDTIKVIPLLFIIFLLVDILVRRISKGDKLTDKYTKYGHIGAALLGIIPQCGISVAFAKLYASGYITIGILVTIFIAGSDEALIIIGAYPDKVNSVFYLLAIKIIIGAIAGYLVNLLIKEKRNRIKSCKPDCKCPRCRKDGNIILYNLIHTLKISLYLIATVFIINLGIDKIGEENFGIILGKNTFLQPIYASLIGMIPSCASSVVLAEGFVKGSVGFGALVAGLCANTGYGILIILKELPFKKSLKIILIVQIISIIVGEAIFLL